MATHTSATTREQTPHVNLTEESTMKIKGLLYIASVFATVKVEQISLFGQLSVTDMKGFKDEISGGTRARRISFATIGFEKIKAEWMPISSLDQLVVKPLLELKQLDHTARME
jgi:hypothetical protein